MENIFSVEVINNLTKALNEAVTAVGVYNANIRIVERNRKGQTWLAVESDTIPCSLPIYKRITIGGEGYFDIEPLESGATAVMQARVTFNLAWKFDYLDGGSNGVKLGDITFRVKENFTEGFYHKQLACVVKDCHRIWVCATTPLNRPCAVNISWEN